MILSMKRLQRLLIGAAILTLIISTATVFASVTNKKAFNVNLPHLHENVTAASGTKTTGLDYGQVQVTKIGGGSDGINCWFRSKKSDGSWDPLNSKYRTFKTVGTKTTYYTNSDTKYTIPHHKGASAQLRMENISKTQIVKDNVAGNVWFN